MYSNVLYAVKMTKRIENKVETKQNRKFTNVFVVTSTNGEFEYTFHTDGKNSHPMSERRLTRFRGPKLESAVQKVSKTTINSLKRLKRNNQKTIYSI